MRYFTLLILYAIAVACSTASAQTIGNTRSPSAVRATITHEPFHFRQSKMEVRIHSGTNVTIQSGENDLDKPKVMTCRGLKGCEISVSSMAQISGTFGNYGLCSFVDGADMDPPCPTQGDDVAIDLQSLRVPQGEHTVQTRVKNNGNPGTVPVWQVTYTLYEK